MKAVVALAGLGVLAMSGCFDDPLAGGTVETENTVAARKYSVDSLLSDGNVQPPASTVATLRLNSANFPFDSTSLAGRNLAVERADGSLLPFQIVFWDKPARIGRIQVRIDSVLQNNGSKIVLRCKPEDSARADSAGVWSGISPSQKLALGSVLVDDFEGTELQSLLPDSGIWYSSNSDSATVSSPMRTAAGSDRSGNALMVTYTAPPNKDKYALVGLALSSHAQSLRTLDSVVFYARGSGKLSIAFDRPSSNPGKAWAHDTLTSGWKKVSVAVADLDAADSIGGNVGWMAVRDSISNLNFIVTGGTELWLDDIRFYGVNRGDFR
jgi:hypothetical protein